MSGNVCGFGFAVNGEKPDFIIPFLEVVDHPHAAAFASARHRPADFSDTAGPGDYLAGFRVLQQKTL